MKTKILPVIICAVSTGFAANSNAQANQNLSNLISPTAVNVNLVPDKNNKRDLGTLNKAWKNLYLDTAIYIEGHRFVAARIGIGAENTALGAEALNANTNGSDNTAIGYNALYSNTTGNQNTAVGLNAMFFNTTGYYNTATGLNALYRNTTGFSNTAMGINSMSANTTGTFNAAFGTQALYSNTTTSYNTALGTLSLYYNTANGNTAVGYAALSNNTAGYSNVAIGINALKNNASGHNSVAVGDSASFHQTENYGNAAFGSKALYSNVSGYDNTAIGSNALYSNTAVWNTAVGAYALYHNTTGDLNTAIGHGALYSNTTGEENTATGMQALVDNTTGINNTADGEETLRFNTSGGSNTATGWQALGSNTTASFNTGDGFEAGNNVTDGWYNTFIGSSANCGSAGHLTNSTAIGNAATVTSSNHVVIGNSSVTSIGGFVNWSNLSDGRVKKNIKQNVPGLEFINKLNPITYNLDLGAVDKIIDRPAVKDKNARPDDSVGRGKVIQPSPTEFDARKAKEQIVYTGFVAQDVEKAAKSLNYDFSGVDKPDNANTLYGLRYSDFVVPLVKAVQELSAKNDDLQRQIDELKQMIVSNQSSANSQLSNVIASASLSQNIPNPFSHTTTINYTLPQQFSSAKIIITDKNGKVLKEAGLSGSGKGSLTVDASTLASSAYQYSLYVDGRLIDTKQMEHIK